MRSSNSLLVSDIAGALVYGVFYLNLVWSISGLWRAAAIGVAIALCLIQGRGFGFRPGAVFFFVPAGLYVLSALVVGPIFDLVKSDIRNMILASAYVAVLGLHRMDQPAWHRFQLQIHRVTMIIAVSAAALGITKLILSSRGYVIPQFVTAEGIYPSGTCLHKEYNVFALGLALGLTSCYALFRSETNYFFRNAALLSLPPIAGALLLTGSRRAVIYLGLALLCALGGGVQRWLSRQRPILRRPRIHALVTFGTILLSLGVATLQWQQVSSIAREVVTSQEYFRISERLETLGTEQALASRVPVWEIALAQLGQNSAEKLLIGDGFYYVAEYGALFGVPEQYPHNFVLSSMLYGGLVQTSATLLMIGLAFRGLLRIGENGRAWAFNLMIQVLFLSASSNSFFSSELALIYVLWALQLRPAVREVVAPRPTVSAGLPPAVFAASAGKFKPQG